MKEGILRHNAQGRYCIEDETCYFTSGDSIELYVDFDCNTWVKGRIEHNGNDYYFIADDGMKVTGLTGIKARG
jgi:hypothetical protein